MKIIKNEIWKITFITFISVTIAIFLHQFAPDPKNEGLLLSPVMTSGLFIPAVSLGLIVTFGLLAVIFVLIQDSLPGNKISKGMRYGFSFAILWMIGFTEGTLWYGTSLKHDLLHGLADAVAILLMCFLLSLYAAKDSKKMDERKNEASILAILVIALFYIIGRYLGYFVLNIDSTINIKPIANFIWIIAIGGWIGYMFSYFRTIREKDKISLTVWFGAIIFGIDWFLFYTFAPMIQKVSIYDNFMRPVIDIVFVIFGVFVYEKYIQKFVSKNKLSPLPKGSLFP